MRGIPRKTWQTLAAFAAMMVVLPMAPGLDWFRPPGYEALDRWMHLPRTDSVTPPPKPAFRPAPTPPGKEALFQDPGGAMQGFYIALLATERKQEHAITRVLHYGDSPTTADLVTGDVRSLLQARFGDAGHGFILVSPPWGWYGHRGVSLKASGWRHEPASQLPRPKDNLFGVGGVNITGYPGSTSLIRLPDGQHRKMEVLYLKQPGGGTFRIEAGDTALAEVSTQNEYKASGFAPAVLPPGTRQVRIVVTNGTVRLFGASFEKSGPGLIYNSFGLNGASVQHLLWHFDPGHWAGQLARQRPDLIVLNYGLNESHFVNYVNSSYRTELRNLLHRLREAAPKTSILVMSPMDRGERDTRGGIVTPPVHQKVVEIQRQTALEAGCAFFNTWQAMGGSGTMGRWYTAQPRLVTADFTHPFPAGAAKVGALLEKALVEDYQRWKAAQQ